MIGFRTLLVNLLLAISGPVGDTLMSYNWVEVVGPTWAVLVVALINGGLRAITSTPIFQSK